MKFRAVAAVLSIGLMGFSFHAQADEFYCEICSMKEYCVAGFWPCWYDEICMRIKCPSGGVRGS